MSRSETGIDAEDVFAGALDHHRAGRLAEASAAYREVLQLVPDHARCHYFLGLVARDRGDARGAEALIRRALELDPGYAEGHNNLGVLLQNSSRAAEALDCFERAVALDPGLGEANFNLAAAYQSENRLDEAAECYRRAIEKIPDFAPAHNNLGTVHHRQNRLEEAAACFERAIAAEPGYAEAHFNRGCVEHERSLLDDARRSFQRAAELTPDNARVHHHLGSLFKDTGELEQSAASLERARSLDPDNTTILIDLGVTYQRMGRLDDAGASYERALTIAPDLARAHANLGTVRRGQGRAAEGLAHFEKALALAPDDADAHIKHAEALLHAGRFEEGWAEYEWRWKHSRFDPRHDRFRAPLWDGSDAAGKTILVWAEQGVGDEIMFAGMLPDLIEAGAEVVFECDPRLVSLFERSIAGLECVPRSDPPSPSTTSDRINAQVALASLGQWLRRDFESFPGRVGYLAADPDRSSALRRSYGADGDDLLVGIAWYSANADIGGDKSLALSDWRPLLAVPGIKVIDLQYGDTGAERARLREEAGIAVVRDEAVDQLADLDAFAAQVAAMDLVISISNSTAHMAGALGVPVWILLTAAPLWRWFEQRDDSPWYPSARLFRQQEAGDWGGVLADMTEALWEFKSQHRPPVAAGERSSSDADDHNKEGITHRRQGRLEEAAASFRSAIDADPAFATAHMNLGTIRQMQGRLEAAIECYEKALARQPDFVEALNNLGLVLKDAGRFEDALQRMQRALALKPESPHIHNNLGTVLHDLGRLDDADEHYLEAIDLDPGYVEAHNNLGSIRDRQGRLEEAAACFERTVSLAPGFAEAHHRLGVVRQKQGAFEDAEACYDRALALDPGFAKAYSDRAMLMHWTNRLDEAEAGHLRAIALDPEAAQAHVNYSETLLLEGRLEEGWREYEWRLGVDGHPAARRRFEALPWRGEDLDGRKLLVWSEQGVGDEIMFAGLLPDLVEAGAEVVVECDPRLVPLFRRSFEGVTCVERTEPPAPETDAGIDFQVPSASLGRWLRPSFEAFPARRAFLLADAGLRDELRGRYLGGNGDLLAGIAWHSRNAEMGHLKSMSLEAWWPVLETPGVVFVDLQYGDTAAERAALEAAAGISVVHDAAVDQMADLDAFAAQVAAMDLVISISNSTAHIAGALGVPVWVLLTAPPLWRWFEQRDDSPWYPSARLLRQTVPGDWEAVLAEAAALLRQRVEAGKDSAP